MQVGAVFPQNVIPPDRESTQAFAQQMEETGFNHILVYDHVLGAVHADRTPPLAGPFDETSLFHEPFVLCTFLAAVTSSLELATGILVLPQRQTAIVAKQAATLSILAGERFRLGVGVGWNYVEYEALNSSFSDRGRRQEEQIEVLRLLWTQPVVDFTGTWHRLDRVGVAPRPRSGIPVWLGGHSNTALERSARIGDGHVIGIRRDPLEVISKLRQNLERAGRDPDEFGMDVVMLIGDTDRSWLRVAESVRDAGATKLSLSTQALEDPYEKQAQLLTESYELLHETII